MTRHRLFARHLAPLAAMAGAALALVACERRPSPGYLRVDAPGAGTFEIYRLANEAPLQFVSEQSGRFNEDVALAPGSYLVLADCSSETVIIYPGAREALTAHRLRFTPPHAVDDRESFSIQCSRSDKTKSRQHLSGRFELSVIHGRRDFLVGMVPIRVDFAAMPDPTTPKDLSYPLSALQVGDFDGNMQESSYFISPVDELIAATKYQRFGAWEYLLPGRYVLEVNGTRMQVDLAEGEERVVKPALLRVSTSPDVDLDLPARINGSPWLVEINVGHWLNFNETYPVLPGVATVAVSGSSQSTEVTLREGATTELAARSIMVDSGCAADDAACRGGKAVSLYLPEEPYPFIESVSDIPVLFIDNGLPLLVGVEGSRDITYEIPANVRDKTVHIGFVRLVPEPQHRPGQVTDLVRVDAVNAPLAGQTLDIQLERPTTVPLVAGLYRLAHFVSAPTGEGDRRNVPRAFTVEAGRIQDVTFPVYLTEKRYNAYKKRLAADAPPSGSEIGTYRSARRVQAL